MKTKFLGTAICCGFMTCTSFLSAQTATTSFGVTLQISADCAVAPSATLNFGIQGVLVADVTGTTTVNVTCTADLPYQIGLDGGTTAGGDTTTRLMTDGTDTVTYRLFQDAARTVNWGNTAGADTLASTGTGSGQTFSVYGVLPAQTTPPAGIYSDTVGVTVTF